MDVDVEEIGETKERNSSENSSSSFDDSNSSPNSDDDDDDRDEVHGEDDATMPDIQVHAILATSIGLQDVLMGDHVSQILDPQVARAQIQNLQAQFAQFQAQLVAVERGRDKDRLLWIQTQGKWHAEREKLIVE